MVTFNDVLVAEENVLGAAVLDTAEGLVDDGVTQEGATMNADESVCTLGIRAPLTATI